MAQGVTSERLIKRLIVSGQSVNDWCVSNPQERATGLQFETAMTIGKQAKLAQSLKAAW